MSKLNYIPQLFWKEVREEENQPIEVSCTLQRFLDSNQFLKQEFKEVLGDGINITPSILTKNEAENLVRECIFSKKLDEEFGSQFFMSV